MNSSESGHGAMSVAKWKLSLWLLRQSHVLARDWKSDWKLGNSYLTVFTVVVTA